jgi:hypothetical protein
VKEVDDEDSGTEGTDSEGADEVDVVGEPVIGLRKSPWREFVCPSVS